MFSHIYSVSDCLTPVPRPQNPLLAAWGLATPPAIPAQREQSQYALRGMGTPEARGWLLRWLRQLTLMVCFIELNIS